MTDKTIRNSGMADTGIYFQLIITVSSNNLLNTPNKNTWQSLEVQRENIIF